MLMRFGYLQEDTPGFLFWEAPVKQQTLVNFTDKMCSVGVARFILWIHFIIELGERNYSDSLYLTLFNLSTRQHSCTWNHNTDILWYTLSVSCIEGFLHYGDHSAPTWCNLITVDLGMPMQCPRSAVQNASREHPVWGDRNIRHDRWLINHRSACTESMGGLPLESPLWAGGQREHQHSNMSPGRITTLTG